VSESVAAGLFGNPGRLGVFDNEFSYSPFRDRLSFVVEKQAL